MNSLDHLFERNRRWAGRHIERDPEFFRRLSLQQKPRYLWIGCSDSRVPATEIVDLDPGEMFVHRNIANVVVHTDLNCLSVIQFAVEVLKVEHIIVTGHYGCGGVGAACRGERVGLTDNWLRHVADVREKHSVRLTIAPNAADRLVELNVIEQVINVCDTSMVRDAWKAGQELTVHGWVYGIHDGLLRDLGMTVSSREEVAAKYDIALATLH